MNIGLPPLDVAIIRLVAPRSASQANPESFEITNEVTNRCKSIIDAVHSKHTQLLDKYKIMSLSFDFLLPLLLFYSLHWNNIDLLVYYCVLSCLSLLNHSLIFVVPVLVSIPLILPYSLLYLHLPVQYSLPYCFPTRSSIVRLMYLDDWG